MMSLVVKVVQRAQTPQYHTVTTVTSPHRTLKNDRCAWVVGPLRNASGVTDTDFIHIYVHIMYDHGDCTQVDVSKLPQLSLI